MKFKILFTSLIVFASAGAILTGCTASDGSSGAGSRNSVSELSVQERDLSENEGSALDETGADTQTDDIVYPDTYLISYDVTDEEGVIYSVSKIRDANGNIYLQDQDSEEIYLCDERGYQRYVGSPDGSFVQVNSETEFGEPYIEEISSFFTDYAETSNKKLLPGVSDQGTDTFLGRSCGVYDIQIGTDTTGMTYTFLVDDETGICLSWQDSVRLGGNEYASDGETFICTEFRTADVPDLEDWVKHGKSE